MSRVPTGLATFLLFLIGTALAVAAADTVPTEIQQPGTQPGEVATFATNCDSCHGGTSNPQFEPSFGWHGSMMSHSMRDPIFWATVGVAEQDFLPNADPTQRGGVGDMCLRCHGPAGWLGGRSTPTDGSSFTGTDERGVECEFCHLQVNPDQPLNVTGTVEAQTAPFQAFDPVTGEGYYGTAQFVINSQGTRVGPYDDADPNHQFFPSPFHRQGEFCGTCHDVSNPAVGDLAHNNGAQVPLTSGFSGVPGAPVDQKAAFNHPPYAYGIVERTFSEWKASALDTFPVASFTSLPAELQVSGGAPEVAYSRAFDVVPPSSNPNRPNYVDGTTRYYTCQTCHMAASTGVGCNKHGVAIRYDLPRHDLVGGGYWMPDVIQYQYDNGRLRFGTLTTGQRTAMASGKSRAEGQLGMAAALAASQVGSDLQVRVTNLTGHKLISGYPEGRRMWLNLRWYDAGAALIHEDGAYGPIGRNVQDIAGTPHAVESILDLHDTVTFEARPGMDQEFAAQLVSLGYDPALPLLYDRMTDAVEETLGQLAAEPAGTIEHTNHFVINNAVYSDNRIPPYGFAYDEARTRNTLPVPATQYGDPGPGGVYQHWRDVSFVVPPGAASVEVRLLYQQTSWEYVQFLWLANDGQGSFLGNEGVNMLDAWLNTGMSPPFTMKSVTVPLAPVFSAPGEASRQDTLLEQMHADYDGVSGAIDVSFTAACDATDQTIYFGPLADVGSYGYTGAVCGLGNGGATSFDPGAGDWFFLVVGNNGSVEGSFGTDGAGFERPQDPDSFACAYPQDLSGTCDGP